MVWWDRPSVPAFECKFVVQDLLGIQREDKASLGYGVNSSIKDKFGWGRDEMCGAAAVCMCCDLMLKHTEKFKS